MRKSTVVSTLLKVNHIYEDTVSLTTNEGAKCSTSRSNMLQAMLKWGYDPVRGTYYPVQIKNGMVVFLWNE